MRRLVVTVLTVAGVAAALVAAPAAVASPRPVPIDVRRVLTDGFDAASSGRTVLMVTLAPAQRAASTTALSALVTGLDARVRHSFAGQDRVSVEVPTSKAAAVAAALRSRGGVSAVRVTVPRTLTAAADTPDDPGYAEQAATWSAVQAPHAWAVTHGSANVKIAVVDSGVDVNHPDLKGKIASRYNAVDGSADVTDQVGHGTFVAGVAAAATDNGLGVAGAGYNTRILAVKVADANGDIDVDDEVAGIRWAATHGAAVINLSLGSDVYDPDEAAAVQYAQDRGVVVVAAAGNVAGASDPGTGPDYPAALPGVIAVGATDGSKRASFSYHGSWVDVAAPGVDLYSTTPTAGSDDFAAGYDHGDGTSFSSPIVAGEVALLKAVAPSASATQLQDAVVKTAHGFAGLGLGHGRVDLLAAVRSLAPGDPPTLISPASGAGVRGRVTLRASSGSPKVRFTAPGGLSTVVPVLGGKATASWATWGLANGKQTIGVASCRTATLCGASRRVTVTVQNPAPVITAPTSATRVSGQFTLRARAGGGAVRFYLDGKSVGVDTTAPYRLAVRTPLKDGTHRVSAVQCSADGTRCAGPRASTVSLRAKSLHPRLGAAKPALFSPGKDGRRDTTDLRVALDRKQSVTLTIRSSTGKVVRTVRLGARSGSLHWTWDGRDRHKHYVVGGSYTITLTTARTSGASVLHGVAQRTVRVDRTAPRLTAITGAGSTFYPVKDGYKDSFKPAVTLSEKGRLTLTVRTKAGALVRQVSATEKAGTHALGWSGRKGGKAVPAGTYRWTYSVQDAAGNRRTSKTYTVTVSGKRLVTRTWSRRVQAASSYRASGTDPLGCAAPSTAYSYYSGGLWLYDGCDHASEGLQMAVAYYKFTLPKAVRYTKLSFGAFGYTYYGPAALRSAFYLPKAVDVRIAAAKRRNATSKSGNAWSRWSTSPDGVVDPGRVVRAALLVTNEYGTPSDFDAAYVQLNLTYQLLG